MKIKSDIYYRFEEEVGEGTVYIYDYSKEIVVKSNQLTYEVLVQIDEGKDIEGIKEVLLSKYDEYSKENVTRVFNKIIEFLLKSDIIRI